MNRVLILSVRAYNFTNDEGTVVEGGTVTFIEPTVPADESRGIRGVPVMTLNCDKSLLPALTLPVDQGTGVSSTPVPPLPGVFDLEMAMRPGKGNRPVLSLVGVRFVSPVNLAKITEFQTKGSRGSS